MFDANDNWDDDFEFQKATMSWKSHENWDDDFEDDQRDDDDDNGDNGDNDNDEDQTVTARSRRIAFSKLTSPPPLPTLPFPFFPSPPHTLPRSPTSSVFSIPNYRPPSSATSQTLLRPTTSRSSSGHGGLSGIPPSPPRHRERERRRLRKKSRPPVGTTYEMTEVPTSSRDDDEVLEPSTTGTLLSRIGSVKKWGVRRKKGSTPTPSADADVDREGDFHHYDPEEQPQSGLTPRPHARRPTSDVPLPASTLLEQKERSRRRSLVPSPSPSFSHSHSHSPSPSPSPSPVPSHFLSQAPGFNTSGTNGTNTTGPVRNASGTITVTTTSSGSARNTSGNSTSSWFMRSVSASHSITTTTSTSTSPSTSASPSASKSLDSSASSRIKSGSSTNLDNDISPSHDLRKTPTRTRPMAVFPSSTSFSRSPSPSPSPVRLTPPGAAAANNNNKTTTNGIRNLPYSPAKLLKRKSLGFVQLKFGLGGGDRDREREEREKEREKEENHASVQHSSTSRNMVYMGLGVGRVGAGGGVGGEDRESESRTESQPQRDREEVNAPEEKGESLNARRGFMDGVRRISLTVGGGEDAGRHTRTKSGSAGPGVPVSASISPSVLGHAPVPYGGEDTHANANVHGLLPPIELQPPSPPQTIGKQSGSGVMGTETETETESSMGGVQSRRALEKTPGSPGSPGQASSLGRSSGVGAGASVPLPLPVPVSVPVPAPVMRRSSLGDLKIPERISQAQVSLRRDLGMVREFAANVEQLKELQVTYRGLVGEVQSVLDTHALHHQQQQQQQPPSRAASPSFLTSLSKPKSRNRSNTNPPLPSSSLHSLPPSQLQPFHQHPQQQQQNTPQIAYKHLASAFYTINSKYRISWECAELLIELGGGASSSSSSSANNDNGTSPPSTSVSAPVLGASGPGVDMNLGLHLNLIGKKGSGGRERAITLAGDESKPASPVPDGESSVRSASPQTQTMSPPLASPPSLAWRASTGRHDLSHRQLVLLREMLHKADSSLNLREVSTSTPIVEESNNTRALNVNREWRWGDAMSSTITLPSEESGGGESRKKRRQSRLGMSGLRDMLRALKRGYGVPNPPPPAVGGGVQASSTSISTEESSLDLRLPPHPQQQQHGRRRAKTSFGPESMRGPSSLTSKPSPRRPSLASIFRIGRGNKASGHESQGVVEHTHGHPPRSTSGRSKSASASASSSAGDGDGDGEEEDWDRIDSVSDLDAALGIRHGHHDDGDDDDDTEARFGSATVRGKGSPYLQDALLHRHTPAAPPPPPVPHLPARPVTPKRSASASQSSIWGAGAESSSGGGQSSIPGTRSTRLSNVEENTDNIQQHTRSSAKTKQHGASSPSRTFLRDPNIQKNGSVRSMPPHSVSGGGLAMTPENIKPLLENGKEVHVRLVECIEEIRSLLSVHADLRMRV